MAATSFARSFLRLGTTIPSAATTVEEMSLGACSVAVPIRTEQGVVAALGIVVPNLRNDRAKLVAAMQVAGQGIARALAAARD